MGFFVPEFLCWFSPFIFIFFFVIFKSSPEIFINFRKKGGRKRERGREREREREKERKRMYQYERNISYLLYKPQLGIEPEIFWFTGTMLQPTEPPSQGGFLPLKKESPKTLLIMG